MLARFPALLLPCALPALLCGAIGQARAQAVPLSQAAPIYPPDLARAGVSGTVDVSCAIATSGVPEGCRVLPGSDPRFSAASLAAAAANRYRPLPAPLPSHRLHYNFALRPEPVRAPINGVTPRYPADLERLGIEGSVTFDCAITAAGLAEDCRILSSTDHRFDAATLDFAARARFQPKIEGGVAVRQDHSTMHINYRLGQP